MLTLENWKATWCGMASVPRSEKTSANSIFGTGVRGFTSRKRAPTATAAQAWGGYYDGDYVPASTFEARLRPDLLSLKVVTGNRQNAAARALLGKDYVTLVDMIDVRSKGDDEDALGANVNGYFVRGIANTNAAIVMSRGDRCGSGCWYSMRAIKCVCATTPMCRRGRSGCPRRVM
ncbi:hypothetical protein [Burkholderia ubonensis]|uniref:hypothetical protein n=1 Tax=Burkholderia ubonensis TaxID=101571 RepID=UPI00114CFE51|nr:hypothetical protein [Burkholderia ubonensis]